MDVVAISEWMKGQGFAQAVWLFPVAFALHVLEEVPGFTAWASRYASPRYSQANFLRDNGLGMVLNLVFCAAVAAFPTTLTVFLFFALVFAQSIFNSLFHLLTTLKYRAYSPGLVTSIALYPPLFYYLTSLALRESLLSRSAALAAVVIAGVIHLLVVTLTVFFPRAVPER